MSCNIYFLCCSRLTLMHPLWGFVLHLVGNTAPPFLRCISMSWVAIESCYGHHTRLGCVWTTISQCLIWVANISLRCCNRLALMHPLFRIVLHLVGNTATLFLRCTRNSRVAIETCYGYHTRVGCVWTAISNVLFGLQIYLCIVAIQGMLLLRNSRVAIETCYGYHTRVGCVWTAISNVLFGLQIYICIVAIQGILLLHF
jgi:hypothetical protein